MPLIGPYTPHFSDTPILNTYWRTHNIKLDYKEESCIFESEVYQSSVLCQNEYPFIAKRVFDVTNYKELLKNKYKWNGTTDIICEEDPKDLNVGDWISANGSCLYFEIYEITGSTIKILNPDLLTIPDSSGLFVLSNYSKNPVFTKYFSKQQFGTNADTPIYQAEEYLLNEVSDFSSYIRE